MKTSVSAMLKSLEKDRATAMQHVESLDCAIASLRAVDGRGSGKRVMSPGARKKISEAQRRRWRLAKQKQRTGQAKQKKP